MSAVSQSPSASEKRPFVVRPMEERDIEQAVEVEKDAFPTLFPVTSFRRELTNRRGRYLALARRPGAADVADSDLPAFPGVNGNRVDVPILNRLMDGARRVAWRRRAPSWKPGDELIAGFVGIWFIVDEAHIVSIGVRAEYRGLGLGEMLLISAIEHAMDMNSLMVTLEVRVSNYVAQNLYRKYGFTERGRRKGYYSDNREDALIMTTDSICSDDYRIRFAGLAQAHEARWGASERVMR